MIVPPIRVKLTGGRETLKAFARVRRRLENPRDYFETWFAEGHPARIQNRWFADAGPDHKQAPARLRRPWLHKTNRKRKQFYAQVLAGHGARPNDISVRERAPRWVWTKNTLRSTYEPVAFEGRSAVIETQRLTRRYDAFFYDLHQGPFVDQMLAQGAEPWDYENLDLSADTELTRMIAEDFEGKFTPRRLLV